MDKVMLHASSYCIFPTPTWPILANYKNNNKKISPEYYPIIILNYVEILCPFLPIVIITGTTLGCYYK